VERAEPTRRSLVRRTSGTVLARAFYDRDPRVVARDLLGKVLVHDAPGEPRVSVRIVEVEAYLGERDPASHAYRGETPRNAVMFGPPGRLYVYFTYGMHWCVNVVCRPPGVAAAVLLRAGHPVEGIEVMRARRPAARRDRDLASGPARLTQALGLTGDVDGADLVRSAVRILADGVDPPRRPGVSTRVGLRPGRGDDARWRWFVPGDPNVSRR
jgi:DNA-3-methyladenine glycosylase